MKLLSAFPWLAVALATSAMSALTVRDLHAQSVTFRFVATVVSVEDNLAGELAAAGGVAIGDRVDGSWTYRLDATDLAPAVSTRGLYAFVQPESRIAASVSGIEFATDPSVVQIAVEVLNDHPVGSAFCDGLRLESGANLVPSAFAAAPESIGVEFADALESPVVPPDFVAATGDALPSRRFDPTWNSESLPVPGWNQANHVTVAEFDPGGLLGGTGYSIVARIDAIEVCPLVDGARACIAQRADLAAGFDTTEVRAVRIAHYAAGTFRADVEPGGAGYPDPTDLIAWTEVRDLQLASPLMPSDSDFWNYAFNGVRVFDDASNPAPATVSLDEDLAPNNGPAFEGEPIRWSIDFYDGDNSPGDLDGDRVHSVLFGAVAPNPFSAHCSVEATTTEVDSGGQVQRQRIASVLNFADHVYHHRLEAEVDVTTGLAWDGSAYTVAESESTLRPFLFTESEWRRLGDFDAAEAPQFFSADELSALSPNQVVTVWVRVPCASDTLSYTAVNRLGLDTLDSHRYYTTGDTFDIEVRMGCSEITTGFAAFLEFDDSMVEFVSGSYSSAPFSLHIDGPIVASGGQIDLNGSVDFAEQPVAGDAVLATLTFEVKATALDGAISIAFRDVAPFETTLSYQGLALPTLTEAAPILVVDTAPPVLEVDSFTSVSNDLGQCSAIIDLAGPVIDGACEIESVTGERDDALALDDPFPASCPGVAPTLVTWTVTDCAGNQSQIAQLVEVTDDEAPELVCTSVVEQADIGMCDAVVDVPVPTVTDNCAASPTLTYTRSDHEFSTLEDPFPVGVTEVLWQATDDCGNTNTCVQLVEIQAINSMIVDLRLPGVHAVDPLERCVSFVATDGTDCTEVVSTIVEFVGSPATGTALITVECGEWTEICAKDEQHTLFDSVDLIVDDDVFVAETTLVLLSGDADNDSDIDIDDVFVLLTQFGSFANPGSCPWSDTAVQDTDFDGDGVVGSEDYAILVSSWLEETTCSCAGFAMGAASFAPNEAARGLRRGHGGGGAGGGGGGGAAASRTVEHLPDELRSRVDFDANGVFDYRDVERFEIEYGLPSHLSALLRRL